MGISPDDKWRDLSGEQMSQTSIQEIRTLKVGEIHCHR